tara:strand:- start:173 stop:445 length:273 start_codon:yes stop_codon:yes gene_type:complete
MADQQTDQTKERKSLGVVFPNVDKASPKSYDLKGTITTPDGIKYRIGGYKSEASGNGKLAKGATYYWMHRVEKLEIAPDSGEAFDPASME